MENRHYRIVGLPGDCIGPEVYRAAAQVLDCLAGVQGFTYELDEQRIGGAAVDAAGEPLPQTTIDACRKADAALLGAVGGPQWDDRPAEQRPELGLLKIRSALNLFCNLRPVVLHPALQHFSPLKPDRLVNVDLMIVRELTSGSYFGKKWRNENEAEDVCRYTREEIERVTRAACRIAMQRDRRLTLVDKANVLETSRLWRIVVRDVVEAEFPKLDLEFLYVDAAAMHLLTRPGDFDVMLTENMFGDILSDEASMLSGSLGLLPSASINEQRFGLYEPIHGSAPDIAGQGIANPYAMLLSTAMMLRHSLDDGEAADALEAGVYSCWEDGVLTRDLDPDGLRTQEVTDAVCERLVR
ncbi:MAG: 3-isopropylmalate dehydrogenase [Xanthomonadales bacterium]|nr:3-isopropylmalate dehydrogenase [Gammaproteobacteria bacterium]MBT8051107.1 3-isopropylmalate dehydrogenase [Gammaproteobacteria bacterium]MBT8055481.1 3-isopropylmalate dehydrogenase [Gammaproteobacteria bacterium]NNJ77714.1 3-isopropylmalate dehydrogenase [Xanthomonadales bacterium]NNL04917.1 3-isopropylmalate dehydrogenase [Xanthomonadales bacterium]